MFKIGKLIREDILANNIERYVERSSSEYSRFLESTPLFSTFYHQNSVFTTNDLGLENVEDDLGRDSPIKYDKINNFPLYNDSNFSLNLELGDMGLNSNIEGELVVLPNTIKPYVGDLFTVNSIGDKHYFKVTNVQQDMIKSKPFYRISFKFDKIIGNDSASKIDSQIQDEYTNIYENIGTENKSIIKTSSFITLDYISKLKVILTKFFVKSFYNVNHNVITYKMNQPDIYLYNMYLNKFLIDNDLLTNVENKIYSDIRLIEYIPNTVDFDAMYEKTIYYALETKDTSQFVERIFGYLDINYPHVSWFRSNLDYKQLIMLSDNNDTETTKEFFYEYLDKEFYGRIKLNMPYASDIDYYMENLIINFIHNSIELPSKETLDLINGTIWRYNMRAYVFIPLLLFIFKQCEKEELRTL